MNKEEFTAAVLDAEKSLYHVAKAILGNDEDCADAMQNAILQSWQKLDTLKKEKYFKTWLTRILINECYQLLRGRKEQVPYEDYLYAESVSQPEEYSELYLELGRLKEPYRVPFVLHYVEGYSIKEIAGMLGVNEGSVKTCLYRGRKLLREKLKGGHEYDEYRLG